MPLPNFTYARVPSHQYLEKIFPLHHQLMFVVNNLVGSLGKPVDLWPDESWRTDPEDESFERVFEPLESFEARLTHLEIHVTGSGLLPGKELPREKRDGMTQYILLEEKEFSRWFRDLIVPGFYNAWARRWVLSVPQLSSALVEFFLRREKRKAAAGPRGASGAKEPRHFVDELTETDLRELRRTASYCVYGWLHSKPKEEVDPEFVFQATSQSPV